jgi:GcrA cell cycle regulator
MPEAWPEERIAQMKNLWERGWSAGEVAAELGNGVTRNAVIGRVHRMGLVRNKKSEPPPKKPPPAPTPRAPRVAEPRPDLGIEIDTIADTKPDTSPFACSIADLRENQCRWVLGKPTNAVYCGAPTARGSWCPAHYRRVYWTGGKRQ